MLSVEALGIVPKTDFYYGHFANATSAREEMKKMQNYSKKVEPKLNAFLEKQEKEKKEKIVNTIKAIAKQTDKMTPFKTNFEKMASNIPKQLAYFRPQVSAKWKNTVNEIKKQVATPIKSETFKPKIATKQESGKSKAGTLISKGIEIPQKNKNFSKTFNKNLENKKQEKTGQAVANNLENKKTVSKSLQEKVAKHVSKKANSSKEKAVSKNKKR